MANARKPLLCLDWDGVIHSYTSGWKGARNIPDPPVPGALQFLVGALDHFTVAIHSSRSGQWGGRRSMKRWLFRHLVEIGHAGDVIADHPWWFERISRTAFADPWTFEVQHAARLVIQEIRWPLFKPPAFLTIDDRAVTFNGPGDFPSYEWIRSFKPWPRRETWPPLPRSVCGDPNPFMALWNDFSCGLIDQSAVASMTDNERVQVEAAMMIARNLKDEHGLRMFQRLAPATALAVVRVVQAVDPIREAERLSGRFIAASEERSTDEHGERHGRGCNI